MLISRKGQLANILVYSFFILTLLFFFVFNSAYEYLFIIILALVVLFTSFTNTNFALIILIFSMLLSPEFKAGGVPGREVVIRTDDLFLFIIFFGWMAKMAVNKELGLIRSTPLNRPILLYVGMCLFSTSISIATGSLNIKSSFFYLLKYFEYFLVFFMVSNNLKTMKEARIFVSFLLLTCFLTCLYAWAQMHTGERLSAPFEGKGGEPNTFAGYLVLMIALILGLMLYAESQKQRAVLLAFLGFILVPFLYTLSRGGWLSFFPMFLTIIAFGKRYRPALITVLVVFAIIGPHVFPKKIYKRIDETFAHEKKIVVLGKKIDMSESAAARIESWNAATERLLHRPLIGYGVPAAGVIDNQYSRVLSEVGIIGFIIFLMLIFKVFKSARYTYNNAEGNNFAQGLSVGLIAGLAGLLALSFTTATFILIRIMEPFWFIVAIVVVLPEIIQAEGKLLVQGVRNG